MENKLLFWKGKTLFGGYIESTFSRFHIIFLLRIQSCFLKHKIIFLCKNILWAKNKCEISNGKNNYIRFFLFFFAEKIFIFETSDSSVAVFLMYEVLMTSQISNSYNIFGFPLKFYETCLCKYFSKEMHYISQKCWFIIRDTCH